MNRSFLVIEDDESTQLLWELILIDLDPTSRIQIASSEVEAMEVFKDERRRFDLVICDYYVGKRLTGIDLWRRYASQADEFLIVSAMSRKQYEDATRTLWRRPPFADKALGLSRMKALMEALLFSHEVRRQPESYIQIQ